MPDNVDASPSITLLMMSVEDPAATKIAYLLALSAPGLDAEQVAALIRGGRWHEVAGAIVTATNSAMVEDSRTIDRLRRDVDRLGYLVAVMRRDRDESTTGTLRQEIDRLIGLGVLKRKARDD